jgi:drug/metabolite transporter (DMT)-like permease
VIIMIVSALLAAVLYGTGAAVEQRQAATAPESSAGRPRLLVQLARQPLWLLGLAAQIAGFAAHAVALRSGSLAVVQMLVGTELIVAVLIVRLWSRRPLSRTSWAAALTVVAGIAMFIVLTLPVAGRAAPLPRHHGALIGAAAAGIAATAFAAGGLRAAGRRRAVLLAVGAGLADSCAAVVTMAFSHVAGHGPAAMATSWSLYALVVCGTGNVLLTQTAYQTGRPLITLPIISAVTPMASAAIGIGLLGETPGRGLTGAVAAAAAVVVTSLALACLARSAPQPEPELAQELTPEPDLGLDLDLELEPAEAPLFVGCCPRPRAADRPDGPVGPVADGPASRVTGGLAGRVADGPADRAGAGVPVC